MQNRTNILFLPNAISLAFLGIRPDLRAFMSFLRGLAF
jgi:hypothetical protein